MRKEWLGLCALVLGCAGEEPVDITGNLYTVDYSNAEMSADIDLASALSALSGGVALIGVAAADEDSLDLQIAMAVEGSDPYTQNFCGSTVSLPPATRDADTFSFGPESVAWTMYEDSDSVFDDVAADGVISEDGTAITDLSMAFGFDLRQALDTFGLDDIEDMCDISDALGLSCIPCSDGITGCVYADAGNLVADVLPTVFEVVDTPYAHPECELTGDE